MTLVAYRKMVRIQETNPKISRFDCPIMDEIRRNPRNNPKKRLNIRWDRCVCNLQQASGKKEKKGKRKEFGGIRNINMDDFVFNF